MGYRPRGHLTNPSKQHAEANQSPTKTADEADVGPPISSDLAAAAPRRGGQRAHGQKARRSSGGAPKSGRWRTGLKGLNRVTLLVHPKTSVLYLQWTDSSGERWRRVSTSLGHSDWSRGTHQAMEKAEELRLAAVAQAAGKPAAGALTLGELFRTYENSRGQRATLSASSVGHERRAAKLFEEFFGADRLVTSLDRAAFDLFIKERREGRIGHGKKTREERQEAPEAVRNRVIEQDVAFMRKVFLWATTIQKDSSGAYLLTSNPWAAFRKPREKNPRRPMLPERSFDLLMETALKTDVMLFTALMLCAETGHRLGSVRQLRWNDVSLDGMAARWREEYDKARNRHDTPISNPAVETMRAWAQHQQDLGYPTKGEHPVFPGSRPRTCINRRVFYKRWKKLVLAVREQHGVRLPPRSGFHSLRRKFASDNLGLGADVLAQMGGWVDIGIIIKAYQRPTTRQLRDVMKTRDAERWARPADQPRDA